MIYFISDALWCNNEIKSDDLILSSKMQHSRKLWNEIPLRAWNRRWKCARNAYVRQPWNKNLFFLSVEMIQRHWIFHGVVFILRLNFIGSISMSTNWFVIIKCKCFISVEIKCSFNWFLEKYSMQCCPSFA